MINTIVNLISIILSTLIFIYYFGKISISRFSHKVTSIIVFPFILLKFFTISQNPYFNFCSSIINYIVMAYILFKNSLLKSSLHALFFSCISILSEDLSYLIIRLIIPKELKLLWNMNIIFIIGNLLSRMLQVIVLKTILNIVDSRYDNEFGNKEFIAFLILPVSSILIILSLHPWIDNSHKGNPIMVLALSGLLYSNLELSHLYCKSIEKERTQHELDLLREKINEKNKYYKQVSLRNQEINKISHDINKNYRLLYQSLIDNDYDKIKLYLENFLDTNIIDRRRYTGIKVIDDILCFKTKINEYDISISYTGNSLNFNHINDIDFNIIFENIIDNAIESCIRSKDKKIHIILTHTNTMNILKVINSCDYVNEINGHYFSVKENSKIHGFGIDIIKQQAIKYDGDVILKYNETFNKFETTVFLPIDKRV